MKNTILAMLLILLLTLLPTALAEQADAWLCTGCLIRVSGESCPQCAAPCPEDGQEDLLLLTFSVDFSKNLLFTKDDVEIFVGGEKAITLPHGTDYEGAVAVPAGPCEVVFRDAALPTLDERFMLNMTQDATFTAAITTHFYGLEFTALSWTAERDTAPLVEGGSGLRNGAQLTLLNATETLGTTACRATDGYVFVLVEFEVVNTTGMTLTMQPETDFTIYCDGYTMQPSARAAQVAPMGFAATLGAAEKMKGMICLELPEDWQELQIVYGNVLLPNDQLLFSIPR